MTGAPLPGTVLAGGLGGALIAGGLVLAVAAWAGWLPPRTRRAGRLAQWGRREWNRVGAAAALGLVTGVVTRWPVAAASVVVLVWLWPRMFGGRSAARARIAQLEALATWTESLRDVTAGAAGLTQAIPATVPGAAPSLQSPLRRLVGMLQAQVPTPEALGRFAEDLDDPSADLVVGALILNAKRRGAELRATLSRLAASTRAEVDMRRKVEASRASLRRGVQIVVGVSVAVALGLAVFQRAYVAPYGTAVGQLVLAGIVGLFVVAFWWLRRLSLVREPGRFLATPEQLSARPVEAGRSW